MMKLFAFAVCMVVIGSAIAAENKKQISEEDLKMRADDIAKWVADRLPEYLNVKSPFYVRSVENMKYELENATPESGVQFTMTLDVMAQVDNAPVFKKCDVTVKDNPWINTRLLVDQPTCKDNAVTF